MTNYQHLFKPDTGAYVTCKNLYLGRYLPIDTPFVLQSVITEAELYQALCNSLSGPPSYHNFDVDEQKVHYREICKNLFYWARDYARMVYIQEDDLYDWKYGVDGYITKFSPLSNRSKIVEEYCTYNSGIDLTASSNEELLIEIKTTTCS